MKLKIKNKSLLPLFMIIILCLVLIPIFSYYINRRENFSTFLPKSGIDRIIFSQGSYDRNYKDSDGKMIDMSGQYGYCLGGEIKCNGDSKLITIIDDYIYGTTYSDKCNDGSRPSCRNNYYSSLLDASMENNINTSDFIFREKGINVMDKQQFLGFVGPYTYNAFVRDSSMSEYMTYYLDKDKSKSSSHKSYCYLVSPNDRVNCQNYYYDINNNNYKGTEATQSKVDKTTGDDIGDDDLEGYDETSDNYADALTDNGGICSDNIPCIADFGTNVGDNLCCGQTGVLQNTKYVCPANAPKCSNFKCGSKFGTCGV